MIVIGVDVHKHSLTAVAVDETGRRLDELTVAYPDELLLAWAGRLGGERLWAVEDCRHVTRALERRLLTEGEELVRVPPKLTGAARRAGRARGKSDPIDALAVAWVALREPDLDRPRPGEERYRELKLLVVHRDDLVDERRRAQQRLRWHLHQLDPSLIVSAGARKTRRRTRSPRRAAPRARSRPPGASASPTRARGGAPPIAGRVQGGVSRFPPARRTLSVPEPVSCAARLSFSQLKCRRPCRQDCSLPRALSSASFHLEKMVGPCLAVVKFAASALRFRQSC